jgi:hypothetical protein
MISSYNNTSQDVAINGLLTFTTDRILTGCTATRNGQTFQLNKPGYYYVTFNADGAATTAVGDIVVVLQNNGVAVPGAIATFTTTVADDATNLAFSTIIRVPPSCCAVDNTANLTLVNTGVAATYTNVNINITKLC